MREKIIAGNWKMNLNFQEAEQLFEELAQNINEKNEAKVIVCPPFPYIELALDNCSETPIQIGAQNVSEHAKGAYTGEVAAEMLKSMNIEYCIIGHSERRKYFNESNENIANKAMQLINNYIHPIVCCGEQLEDREAEKHFDVIKQQIEGSLFNIDPKLFPMVVLAYEPVWAIGTGKTASTDQAQEMHAYIRSLIKEKFGDVIAENLSILYGGSCNAKNAKELFSNPDVDGGLIGGASLKSNDFNQIINSI